MHRRSVVWSVVGTLLLLSAFAAMPAQAGGCHPKSPDPTSAEGGDKVTVPVKGCEFGPTVLHVPEGATVTWVNHDPVGHTVTGTNLTWGDTEELFKGESLQFRFEESGVYPYQCFFHPGMAGAVVVGDGKSDDTIAAPVAVPPSSGDDPRPPSSDSAPQADATGMSIASTVALAVLALMAGLGAGIVLKSRIEAQPKRVAQT